MTGPALQGMCAGKTCMHQRSARTTQPFDTPVYYYVRDTNLRHSLRLGVGRQLRWPPNQAAGFSSEVTRSR